jgi:hypothetical protein
MAHLQSGGGVDRLRADIDRGRTGDKFPWPDPAAAPLGTDEEAAGTPISADIAEQCRRAETTGAARHVHRDGPGPTWTLIGIILAVGACVVAVGFSIQP